MKWIVIKTPETPVLYILILLALLLVACKQENKPFHRTGWQEKTDFSYAYREAMVQDLMAKHLYKGMPYQILIDLLGKPTALTDLQPDIVAYEVMTAYKLDIDPVASKTLYIKLNADSTVSDFYIKEWHKER